MKQENIIILIMSIIVVLYILVYYTAIKPAIAGITELNAELTQLNNTANKYL